MIWPVIEARSDEDLVRRLPPEATIVAIDEGGREMDSHAWSRWLDERRLEARDLWLVVGGPEGLPGEALDRAAESLPSQGEVGALRDLSVGSILPQGPQPGRPVEVLGPINVERGHAGSTTFQLEGPEPVEAAHVERRQA